MQQATSYYPTFITTLISLSSWQQKLLATSIATLVLAIAANISIPTYPVPFTLQSLVVLLVGAFLGRKLAMIAVLQYLFLGAIGFPVFASKAGITALLSPTVGYLLGYIASAYIAGFAAEKGYDRQFIKGLIAFALAHQVIFVFGVIYLAIYFQISFIDAFKIGYLPFIGFDLLKFSLATMIMFMLWGYRANK
ncbi:biotin transporter BioY [Orbus wheelerorum]|uniref:biotin transporter BioY n=1 Tax=Orbus wheelerorum TaxID=3074111 RepID=UPI00370DCC61